jgi:predicted metallo-beta-lactamase superfamily hydrolase
MGFNVSQKYRINDLSFDAGGVTVEVEKIDGKRFEYDNIKNSSAYIRTLKKDPTVVNAWIK